MSGLPDSGNQLVAGMRTMKRALNGVAWCAAVLFAAQVAYADEAESGDDGKYLYLKSRAGTLADNLPDGTASQLGMLSSSAASPGLGADHSGLLRQVASGGRDEGVPSSLLANDTFQIGSFTPRYAGFQFGYGQGGGEDGAAPNRGFNIAISSTYFAGGLGFTGAAVPNFRVLSNDNRAYNVGLNIGFAGFKLGASYLRGEREAEFGYQGYDFGIMYEGRAWATSLQFAEYTQRRDNLTLLGPDSDKVQSIEFGASYTFGLGITLAGRFEYYDYGSSFLREDADDAQVFFLGTNLSF